MRTVSLSAALVLTLGSLAGAQRSALASIHEAAPPLSRSTLVWGDFDLDGLEDVYQLDPTSGDRLLRNLGDGTFEDVTQTALPLVKNGGSRYATFIDVDADELIDIYLIGSHRNSRVLRNTGLAAFEDITLDSAIAHLEPARWAEWRDYDGDGLPDLQVVLPFRDALFHNTGEGRFEQVDLRHSLAQRSAVPLTGQNDARQPLRGLNLDDVYVNDNAGEVDSADVADGSLIGADVSTSIGDVTHTGGSVGIGTSTPAARLDVSGNVAVNGSPVISAAGQWVGDPTGLIGPTGPQGPPGVLPAGTDPTGSGKPVNNMQPFQAVSYIIVIDGSATYPGRGGGVQTTGPLIGEINLFAGNFAPSGYALCNGQVLPISTYSALWTLLGTIYGGDGETTFALPDLRGRAPMHQGTGPGLSVRPIGAKGGSESNTLTTSNLATHSHGITPP